jgi:DNA-directed RNA polymerase subunit RPC12/RpoP
MTDTPSDETIRKMNSNWIHGACIKCGKEFLFWKDATGRRCNECERQGIVHPEPTASIEYKQLFASHQDLTRKLEVAVEALEFYANTIHYDYDHTKGMNYIWNDLGKLAREALTKLKEGER